MDKDVLTNLRNDWLIQEFVINMVPVPALAYFVWTCFPFAKENMSQFFGFILFAVGGCFTAGFAARKYASRKMISIVTKES